MQLLVGVATKQVQGSSATLCKHRGGRESKILLVRAVGYV